MSEAGFEARSNDRINDIAARLSRQLGRHSYLGGFEGLQLAQLGDEEPLAELKNDLNDAIIGQDEGVEAIISALYREKIRNKNRPIASMLLLGPTGVGKSETGKELAHLLHGDANGYLRIDCSVFNNGYNVSSLIGASAGYVGYGDQPIFASEALERKRCVVVFDEIEKGHPKLWDFLLQILDEGEITILSKSKDKEETTVSFRDAIILITSNVGSTDVARMIGGGGFGFGADESGEPASKKQLDKTVNEALMKQFRPELLGRIDKKIVYRPLSDEQYGMILERYVDKANERYQELGIMMTLTPELRDEIVASCDDRKTFGARPVLRRYEDIVESLLAQHIATGGIPEGSRVFAVQNNETERPVSDPGRVLLYHMADRALLPYRRMLTAASSEAEPAAEMPAAILNNEG